MIPLPFAVQDVIVGFAPLFSKRVFAHVTVLIAGAILSPGKRTATAVLRVMSKGDESGALAPSMVSRHADAAARGEKKGFIFPIRGAGASGSSSSQACSMQYQP